MIPKTIHYCWFGRQPYSPLIELCIESWKRFLPDYKMVLWNEDSFDIVNSNQFVIQAYEAGKYAFVSDYVRMYALYHHGGVYLDTDVEVVKSFDALLTNDVFFGFENKHLIASGLGCGSIASHWFIKELMNEYEQIEFVKTDGTYDMTPCPSRETKVAVRYGLVLNNETQYLQNMLFLNTKHLNPVYIEWFDHVFEKYITIDNETLSIHHYANSWGASKVNNFFHKLKWKALKIEEVSNYKFAKLYISLVNIISGIFALRRKKC